MTSTPSNKSHRDKLGLESDTKSETAFGCPRNSLGNRYIYTVVSARARGFSVGVNLNPDKHCNFDCIYCEVNRAKPGLITKVDVELINRELRRTLEMVVSGAIKRVPCYAKLPPELLELRHVALSGDGEPTLCPNFLEAVQSITHIRAAGKIPFFKLVLITNATGLDLPQVSDGLKLFTSEDEIWAKLDAGTQQMMDKVNRSNVPLEKVLANILTQGRRRPVVIQSLFSNLDGKEPAQSEIEQYAERLNELKQAGAMISLVQIYSAVRPPFRNNCQHLPLKTLFEIARHVRLATGLNVEVY